jgi:hypothetical protein
MNNKSKSLLVIVCSAFLVLACTSATTNPSFGPIQDDKFQDVFLESIDEDQQDIIFYSRAIWYPSKNGFKFLPAGGKSRKGVVVFTRKNIYFSEWSAKKYTTVFSTGYSQIKETRLASNELFGRIVIKNDGFNSFEILGVNGPDLPDKDEAEVAYKIILQQSGQ